MNSISYEPVTQSLPIMSSRLKWCKEVGWTPMPVEQRTDPPSESSTPARRAAARARTLVTLLVLFACLVPAQLAAAAVTPKVVLDPDNDFAFGVHDGITYHGFPIQHDIALAVQAKLPSVCAANIVVTRGAFPPSVPESVRAAQMQDADVSVTLSLNSNEGVEWGTLTDGGSSAFATAAGGNLAFGTELTNQMGAFTGRPTTPVNEEQTGGRVYPYPEFAALPGTYAQFFMMFIDHSYRLGGHQERPGGDGRRDRHRDRTDAREQGLPLPRFVPGAAERRPAAAAAQPRLSAVPALRGRAGVHVDRQLLDGGGDLLAARRGRAGDRPHPELQRPVRRGLPGRPRLAVRLWLPPAAVQRRQRRGVPARRARPGVRAGRRRRVHDARRRVRDADAAAGHDVRVVHADRHPS